MIDQEKIDEIQRVIDNLLVFGDHISGSKIKTQKDYRQIIYYTYSCKLKLCKVYMKTCPIRGELIVDIKIDNRCIFWRNFEFPIDLNSLQDKIDNSVANLVKAADKRDDSLVRHDRRANTLLKLKEDLTKCKIFLDFRKQGYGWKDITYNVIMYSTQLSIPLIFKKNVRNTRIDKTNIITYAYEAQDIIYNNKDKILKSIDKALLKIANKKSSLKDLKESQENEIDVLKLLI